MTKKKNKKRTIISEIKRIDRRKNTPAKFKKRLLKTREDIVDKKELLKSLSNSQKYDYFISGLRDNLKPIFDELISHNQHLFDDESFIDIVATNDFLEMFLNQPEKDDLSLFSVWFDEIREYFSQQKTPVPRLLSLANTKISDPQKIPLIVLAPGRLLIEDIFLYLTKIDQEDFMYKNLMTLVNQLREAKRLLPVIILVVDKFGNMTSFSVSLN